MDSIPGCTLKAGKGPFSALCGSRREKYEQADPVTSILKFNTLIRLLSLQIGHLTTFLLDSEYLS